MSVLQTVRSRILAQIATAVAALPNFGACVLPGEISQARQQTVQQKLADNAYVAYLSAGPDERLPESENSSGIESLSMVVEVRIFIPAAPIAADTTAAQVDDELCGELSALVYKLYTTPAGAGYGGWPDSGTRLATSTRYVGGGGLFVETEEGGLGMPFTTHVFEVRYRHSYGDPTVPR